MGTLTMILIRKLIPKTRQKADQIRKRDFKLRSDAVEIPTLTAARDINPIDKVEESDDMKPEFISSDKDTKVFFCQMCPFSHKNGHTFRNHVRQVHTKGYKCDWE